MTTSLADLLAIHLPDRPAPDPLPEPDLVPNRSALTWADPETSTWAVYFRRADLQQAAEAFEHLAADLGDVEDRFIHLRPEGQAGVTMIVVREETEGRAPPDISSFAELRALCDDIARRSAPLAAFNRRARDLWAAAA